MKNLSIAFLMLAFMSGVGFSQQNKWALFSSREANVQAVFPGKPELTKTGQQGQNNYQILLDLGDKAFILMTVDVPLPAAPTQHKLTNIYYAGRNGLLKTFPGSKLISERNMTIDGKFGREVLVDTNDFFMKYRFFVYDNRLYEAGVNAALARKDDLELQAEFDKVFNSFQVYRAH